MNETTLLQHLETVAEKLSLTVTYQNLRKLSIYSRGGLYRLKDEQVVLIETSLTLSEKIDILADALSRFDMEGISMPPLVRKIIAGKKTSGTPADGAESQTAALQSDAVSENNQTEPE